MFYIQNFLKGSYYIISAKHLSEAWRATLQVGEVRIIAFRPAWHTEVEYLDMVQVIEFCRLHSVCRNKSPNKEPKADERFSSARIYANLPVGRSFVIIYQIQADYLPIHSFHLLHLRLKTSRFVAL